LTIIREKAYLLFYTFFSHSDYYIKAFLFPVLLFPKKIFALYSGNLFKTQVT